MPRLTGGLADPNPTGYRPLKLDRSLGQSRYTRQAAPQVRKPPMRWIPESWSEPLRWPFVVLGVAFFGAAFAEDAYQPATRHLLDYLLPWAALFGIVGLLQLIPPWTTGAPARDQGVPNGARCFPAGCGNCLLRPSSILHHQRGS